MRKKRNHISTVGLALEPDSSSTLEVCVGFRAGGLGWCISIRAVLLQMCSDGGKKCSREKQNRLEAKQDREGNRVASVSEQKLFVIAAVVSTELRRTSDWTI